MSLTPEQQRTTSLEISQNVLLSGLSVEQIAHRLGFTDARLERTMRVSGGSPADVWALRDLLVRAVKDAGKQPVPFTVLTDGMRSAAASWFGVSQE